MTNYERIKQMTVDEMAKFLAYPTDCRSLLRNNVEPCPFPADFCEPTYCYKQWLLQEVEE